MFNTRELRGAYSTVPTKTRSSPDVSVSMFLSIEVLDFSTEAAAARERTRSAAAFPIANFASPTTSLQARRLKPKSLLVVLSVRRMVPFALMSIPRLRSCPARDQLNQAKAMRVTAITPTGNAISVPPDRARTIVVMPTKPPASPNVRLRESRYARMTRATSEVIGISASLIRYYDSTRMPPTALASYITLLGPRRM
jgi:hypothetical protein